MKCGPIKVIYFIKNILKNINLQAFYFICSVGSDCMQKFCETLESKSQMLYNQYWKTAKKPKTELEIDEQYMQEFNKCTACDESIIIDERDIYFNYFTGEYVGPIHNKM